MQSSPSLPRSAAELFQGLPPSNVPGAFPRSLLPAHERILFETRPSLLGLYWGRIALCAGFGLFLLIGIGQPGDLENPAFWFFEIVVLLVLAASILAWWNTSYALTDQRVLSVSGLGQRNLVDAPYSSVENLSMEAGVSGGLRFDCAFAVHGFALSPGLRAQRTIYWTALRQPVYAFVQAAFALQAHPTPPAPLGLLGPPAPFASTNASSVLPGLFPTPATPAPLAPEAPSSNPVPTGHVNGLPASSPPPAPPTAWGAGITVASAPSPLPPSRMLNTMKCPFCGASIDLRTLNFAAPQCPACRQPIAPQA